MTTAVVEPEAVPSEQTPPEVAPGEDEVAEEAVVADAVPLLQQVGPWLGYAGCFVGAGLVSGGLVHHPLDPSRYTRLAVVGVVVFVVATLVTEVLLAKERPPRARLLRLVGTSLLLSLGIGMLSGGIQHFSELPTRGALLVPLGVVLSYVAFVLRGGGPKALLGKVGAGVLLLAVGLHLGLGKLAAGAPPAAHHHGTAPAAGDPHAPAATSPSTADLQAHLDELKDLQAQLAEISAG